MYMYLSLSVPVHGQSSGGGGAAQESGGWRLELVSRPVNRQR